MRGFHPLWMAATIFLTLAAGCGRDAAPPATEAEKPAGRLVPAVVAGFERGQGGWRVETGAVGRAEVVTGGASRGEKWLAVPVESVAGEERVVDVRGDVPSGDWLRFGDTLRADVRMDPVGAEVVVQPYLVTSTGQETLGPESAVTGQWSALVWNAGAALGNVARIGLRWRVSGDWTGRLGVDNVRVGAADALSTAYSVAYGPFATRDMASETMKTLKSAGVESFPIYEEGWYLNLGTFSTRASANKEAQRLKSEGFTTTVLVR